MRQAKITKAAALLLLILSIVVILMYGKPFLVPITFAGLLAMLLLPVVKWLQRKGMNHVLAIIISLLSFVGFIALVIFFISLQVSDLAENATQLEQQVTEKYQQVRDYVSKEFGIDEQQQKEVLKQQQEKSSGQVGSVVLGLVSGLGGMLTNFLLVLVYSFLFIFFRQRIKKFIVQLVPTGEKENAQSCVQKTQQVAQAYLKGLSLMIVCLWIMYSIGFTIAGVKNAIFFAVLCGLLEIIPFIGNLTGTALTVLMALVQGGDMNLVIAILVTYGLVQFIQTYLLEPMVVGSGVNINPMATIIGLVAGELLWGIPGMVVAIPLLGMIKIIFEHIPAMQPYAYLIGEEKKEDGKWKKALKKFTSKVKKMFGK